MCTASPRTTSCRRPISIRTSTIRINSDRLAFYF
jgi:hypothetical protein